jgi:glycosyltransferase involved in cell wall biosynthesis
MRPPEASSCRRIVLFVVNDPRFFVTHRLELARGIRRAGYDVHVAVPDEHNAPEIIRGAGFVVHLVPIDRQGLNPLADLRTIGSLIGLYRSLRPTIVHHVTVKPVLYGSLAARLTGVPCVVNAISGLGTLFSDGGAVAATRSAAIRRMYKIFIQHPNSRTVFQNQEDRAVFMKARIVRFETTVLIFGSGVDLTEFHPEVASDEPPIVILPARFLKQKGIREFAAAARILQAEGISARFALVGDTAENRDAVPRSDLDAWRAEGVIEDWGWTDDMPGTVARSSIVCLPSYYREGIPKALIDGSAGGRALVTTDMPGCRDVVENGVNGLIVQPRDVGSLVDALRTLLLDPPLRTRMGRKAREVAETRYGLERVVDATLNCYESLLQGR